MLETSTIVFMIIILSITWGALGFLLNKAHRQDKRKERQK